jgi:VanZ family protein
VDESCPERREAPYSAHRGHRFLAFLAYLAFVVYGSLVPFDYRAHSLHQALEQFRHIAYLNLGVASRAAWIANIVLYVPLAFLACAWILGLRADSRFRRTLGVLFMFALCGGVAVAVEFTQIFFAPRTVSLNDPLAETLGTVVCRAIWDSDARLKEIGFDFFDTASGDACTLAPNRLW